MSSTHSIWAYLVSKQDSVGAVSNRHNATVHVYAPALLPTDWTVITDSTDVLSTNSDRSKMKVLFRYKLMIGHVRTRRALAIPIPCVRIQKYKIFSPKYTVIKFSRVSRVIHSSVHVDKGI